MRRNLVVAITGASGARYSLRLLQVLLAAGCEVYLTINAAGAVVIEQELDLTVALDDFQPAMLGLASGERLHYYRCDDLLAPMASGSLPTDGMVVCPCSCAALARLPTARARI